MTRKRTLSAALATTASVALLAGLSPAQAQMGGTPGGPCSTTVETPAIMNCTLPSSKAPGAGSFPGSFLVPGTTTSFAVHGIIWFAVDKDIGPHGGNTAGGLGAVQLEGNGVTEAAAGTENGGLSFNTKATRPNIETRTPTAYGELKTYIEFDFNQTSGYALNGNADLFRVRMAYGTLGPWLIGQTNTTYEDPSTFPDLADASLDAGMMQSGILRRPQIRYTYLAGNGVVLAAAAEEFGYSTSLGNAFGYAADGKAVTEVSPNDNSGFFAASVPTGIGGFAAGKANLGGYVNWPKLVGSAEWDQPWGHVKFAVAGGVNEDRNGGFTSAATIGGTTAAAGVVQAFPLNVQKPEYALNLSGHVNAWGKDRLAGSVRYVYAASDYSDDMWSGGDILNTSNNTWAATKQISMYANYEHFFTNQWRGNLSAGWAHLSGNPGFATAATLAGLEAEHFTAHANVIFAPVPQVDFITEWAHDFRKVQSEASGTVDRVEEDVKFYF